MPASNVYRARLALEQASFKLTSLAGALEALHDGALSDFPRDRVALAAFIVELERINAEARASVRAADALLADSTACGADDETI